MLVSFGCGGGQGTEPAPERRTLSLAGTVTMFGAALPGVTVTLTGPAGATAITDATGRYSFSGLSAGAYTMTPSRSGYTFDPATLTQTLADSSVSSGTIQASRIPTYFSLRGFNFSAFGSDYWSVNADNESALQWLVSEGANMVALDWIVEFNDDGTIVGTGGSVQPPWSDIARVAARAKALGLYVVLKPHVGSPKLPGQNRTADNTTISTFLPDNFFPAWQRYLVEMVRQMPAGSVDAIAIGTELNFIDWQLRPNWEVLVQSLRGIYGGQLTYDAMFSQFNGSKDVTDVVFWDLLDFISCSYYVRLTHDDATPVAGLAALFRNNSAVARTDAIGVLQAVAAKYGKQVLAIEGGYQSSNDGLWDVNADFSGRGVENQDLQARGLDAYLLSLNS